MRGCLRNPPPELWKSIIETTAVLADPGYPATLWTVIGEVVFEYVSV